MDKSLNNTPPVAKNILINAASIRMGGGLTYLENLLKELPKVKHSFQIFVLMPEGVNISFFSRGINLIKIKEPRFFIGKFLFNQFGLRKILKKHNIDILFQMANYAMFLCPAKQIVLLRQSHFFSKIFLENIYPLFSFKKRVDLILRRFLIILSTRTADLVLAPSQAMTDDIKNFVFLPPSKVFINHYGTYLENFSNSFNSMEKGKSINILYAAYYWDHKNFGTLLGAIAILDKIIKQDFYVTLPFSFEDPVNKYCVTFKKDNILFSNPVIKKHIRPIGKLPYSKMIEVYKTADIFVWPTLTEAFGHPLVEAMASGLPIVASDIPINHEICLGAAIYFDSLSPEDLAKKLKDLVEDRDLKIRLSGEGQKRVQDFRWEDHVRRFVDFLHNV